MNRMKPRQEQGLKSQAFYTLGEFAKAAGLSRYRTLRLLEAADVKVHRSGRLCIVFLVDLHRAFPELIPSIGLRGGARDSSSLVKSRGVS